MTKSVRRFYFAALGVLIVLSAYPLVMGAKIILLQLIDGGIRPEDYARYVIPYTAICLSILIAAALYPLISKLKRLPILTATVLALGLFVGAELYMESISINRPASPNTEVSGPAQNDSNSAVTDDNAVALQLTICAFTPAATNAYLKDPATQVPGAGAILRQDYSNTYKIHYFLVSFVIIILVTGIVYGYGKYFSGGARAARISLRLQLAAAVLLLGLCVFANFTGFFRERTDYLSALSSVLTGLFFIVLGSALGIYVGSRLIDKSRALAVTLPATVAAVVCAVMYYGELNLLGGTLYRFGYSWFFEGLPGIVVAPVDILVILATGAVTAAVMSKARARFALLS
jgi:hypothetical protein